jgi:hypothetical protein
MLSGLKEIPFTGAIAVFSKAMTRLLAAPLILLCATGHAGLISFHGTQTWLNEGDGLGSWYVDGHSLWQFDFIINEAASYDFQASPEFYSSPLGRQYDPYARIYNGMVHEGGTVATTYFPASLFLDIGNYSMVFGFGPFGSDSATEDLFNFSSISQSPAPFEAFDFQITVAGPGVSVPEPGGLVLLMIGLVGVLVAYRRRMLSRE